MSFSPTVRLFVSSTFSDLSAERDALQRNVFPRLKQLWLSKETRFQAIDLRWSISGEAGRGNKTVRICPARAGALPVEPSQAGLPRTNHREQMNETTGDTRDSQPEMHHANVGNLRR